MNWKYVKPLKSKDLIEEFSNMVGYIFPDDFIKCVCDNNGGRPEKRCFDTDVTSERSLKSFLSFNKDDLETTWKMFDWNKIAFTKKYVPFAIDNFGNVICFSVVDNSVVFINHENGEVEKISKSFQFFMSTLYEKNDM